MAHYIERTCVGLSNHVFEKALRILSIPALEYVLNDINTRIQDGIESGHTAYVEQQNELAGYVNAELDSRKQDVH